MARVLNYTFDDSDLKFGDTCVAADCCFAFDEGALNWQLWMASVLTSMVFNAPPLLVSLQ